MADITSGCTLDGYMIGQGGLGIASVYTAATADDGDYFDMDTLLGFDVNVKNIIGTQSLTTTNVAELFTCTGTSTTPDRVTIGGSTDNAARWVIVLFTARKSTGGSA